MDEPRGERGREPIAIQQAMGGSPLRAYQDLVVGSRGLGRLALYELVMLTSSWVPGALGLLLWKLLYPLLLGAVGRGVAFGQGVVGHPGDRRSSYIDLTPAGRRLLAAAGRTFAEEVEGRIRSPLSSRQFQQYAATIRQLRHAFRSPATPVTSSIHKSRVDRT